MSELIEKNTEFLEEQWFKHVDLYRVPWCFELPSLTKQILDAWVYNAVIVLWCLVKWQTPHFEYISAEVSRWCMDLGMTYETPCIFWVLTCNTLEQAQARVDANYAIYTLNYLAQHGKALQHVQDRYEEVMERMNKEVWDIGLGE
jgi:6,7-dimethyl-8-ribityllumazine synthase